MKVFNRIAVVSLVLGVALGFGSFTTAQADTIAYWRFEGDASTFASDSGPNHLDLSLSGVGPTAAGLPSEGPGSHFSNPIPQTGASNSQMASCDTSVANGYFYRSYQSVLKVTNFTVEAYVNRATDATTNKNQYIASLWDDTTGNRSWALAVARSVSPPSGTVYKELFLIVSSDGSTSKTVGSGLTMDTGIDYFVAITYNSSTSITYYVKNLETGVLQTSTKAIPFSEGDSLFQAEAKFRIGAVTNSEWTGLLDEVRYSNTALRDCK